MKVRKAQRVLMAQRVKKVLLAQPVKKVLLAQRVLKVQSVPQAQLDHKVRLARLVRLA